MRPIDSGRKPVRIARGKDAVARHHYDRERSLNLPQRVGNGVDQPWSPGECAINCTMISESLVVLEEWRPDARAARAGCPRLTRFPLCAIAIRPLVDSTRMG